MRLIVKLFLGSGLIAAVCPIRGAAQCAQTDPALLPIKQAITARFPTTHTTGDMKDILRAGAVMVFKKEKMTMYSTATVRVGLNGHCLPEIDYKDGKLGMSRMTIFSTTSMGKPLDAYQSRVFVADEKFWIVDVEVVKDGAILQVLSDPVDDVRYTAWVKVLFPKGQFTADEAIAKISDVMDVDSSSAVQASAPPPAPASEPVQPIKDIPPPPPPPDQPAPAPKTIAVGQTKDIVTATWGQPSKVIKLASKEIFVYPDMKVTFVAGKVSDVQ